MKLSLVALIMVGAVSQRAVAQAVSPAGVVNRPVVADTTPTYTKDKAFAIRSLTGTLGLMAGVAAGLGLAAATGPHACNDGCEGTGTDGALAIAALVSVLGTPVGASIPKLSPKCTFGSRLLRSTAGSIVGGVLGTAIAFNLHGNEPFLIGAPLGAVLGSSTALLGC